MSQLLTKVSHIVRLQALVTQLIPSYDVSISNVTDAYATRRTTRKELRQQINQSSKLRRQHLIARAIALELNIKKLITIEDQCSLHAAVKHYFNPPNKSSLSKVKIPVDNDDWNNIPKDKSVQWKPITESNKIEKV